MTEKDYLRKMHLLRDELGCANLAEPYDPGTHGDIVAKINNLNHLWYLSLRRRHWFFVVFIFFLLVGLSFIGAVILWKLKN